MRRVVGTIGLLVVVAAVGYTLLPFARHAPRSTPTASTGYGSAGWERGVVQAPCSNAWQADGGWCATTGAKRRTTAVAVGGTATVWAAIMVLILPPRRRKPSARPVFSAPGEPAREARPIAA